MDVCALAGAEFEFRFQWYLACPKERVMRYGVAALVFGAGLAAFLAARPAAAVKPFFEQFKSMYVDPKTTNHNKLIFNLAVEKKQCTICHKLKTPHGAPFNAYGEQVSKLLNAKRDAANPRAIKAALGKVSRLKSIADDPKSPTFGERLRTGKLPVGEIHVVPKDSSK
jgi:hypothetical protein